jgi:hypothetical protein
MVAREASTLPHTAAWQVLMAQMLLQNRFRWLGNWCGFCQIDVKSLRSAGRPPAPIRELFHRLLSNSLFLRLDSHV